MVRVVVVLVLVVMMVVQLLLLLVSTYQTFYNRNPLQRGVGGLKFLQQLLTPFLRWSATLFLLSVKAAQPPPVSSLVVVV